MDFIKQTFAEFSKNRCTTLAASLAYYTIFSLPPLLFLLVSTVSIGLSTFSDSDTAEEKAEQVIEQQVQQMVGNKAASETVRDILDARQEATGNWWKTLLSIGGIVVGATGVVAALQDSLNRVWEVKADPDDSGWLQVIKKRVLSFGMIIGLGFILLVSLLISSVLIAAGNQIGQWLGLSSFIAQIINFSVQFLFVSVVFAAIFKVMPDATIRWKDVIVGALVTAVLFSVGRFLLQLYLSNSNPGAQLGSAAASLAILLVWVYYSALIVLYGAEVTQVYASTYGQGIQPENHAVRFKEVVANPDGSVPRTKPPAGPDTDPESQSSSANV